MAFDGGLVWVGNNKIPLNLMVLSGYDTTPNQRLELSAERDSNALLHRQTSKNTKSTVKVEFLDGLSLKDLKTLKSILDKGYIKKVERKVHLRYWNTEDLDYRTGTFYLSDVNYKVKKVDKEKNDLIYESFTWEFIEY